MNKENRIRPLSPEQLAERARLGNPHPGLVEDDWRTPLEMALNKMHEEEGGPATDAIVDHPRFGADAVTKEVRWESRIFGSVTIRVDTFAMGKSRQVDRFTLEVPLFLQGDYPSVINFSMSRSLTNGVRLYHTKKDQVIDCTSSKVPQFPVSAKWAEACRGKVPHTREKHEDNIDLVFLDPEGCFVQLEIGLSSWNGNFFLTIQQMYAGQVVRTTSAKAKEIGLETVEAEGCHASVVPLWPESAYPGANYTRNFPMAPGFIKAAVKSGSSVPLSRCAVARWEPAIPELPLALKEGGWNMEVVLWYCVAWQGGFTYSKGQANCYVHAKAIQDSDGNPIWKKGCPALTPMHGVAVKYETASDGRRKAIAVRVL